MKETFIPYVEIHQILNYNFKTEKLSYFNKNFQKKNNILKYLKLKIKEISKNGLVQI